MKYAPIITLAAVLIVSGCVQEVTNRSIGLGDVSLGQQLIDLQSALDAEAIDEDEYETIKENLIAAASLCTGELAEGEDEEEEESFWF